MTRVPLGLSVALGILISAIFCQSAKAQIVLSIPTVNTFSVRTTVMVPDGGQMLLGGVNRGSIGSIERGVPGLSGFPGVGRAFRNRGIGQEYGSAKSSVTATVISTSEIEEQVMATAERIAVARAAKNPNLRPDVVRQAKFMSKNIGRRR